MIIVFHPPSRQVNSEKVPSMSLLRVFAFYFSGLSEKILLKSEIGEVHGRFEGRKQVRGVKISVRGETLLQCAKKIEFQMQVTRCCASKLKIKRNFLKFFKFFFFFVFSK